MSSPGAWEPLVWPDRWHLSHPVQPAANLRQMGRCVCPHLRRDRQCGLWLRERPPRLAVLGPGCHATSAQMSETTFKRNYLQTEGLEVSNAKNTQDTEDRGPAPPPWR